MSAVVKDFLCPCGCGDGRRSGLGGADISAVVGRNPRRTAWSVWAFKRHIIDAPDPEALPEYMQWGSILQRPMLEEYGRREKAEDLELYFDTLFRHPDRPWQIGHPDGDRASSSIVVEGKTVGFLQAHQYGEAGTDQIPEQDILQAQWYMSLLGRELAHVPVLVGGQELRIFVVQASPTLQNFLLEAADRFWTKHVLADDEPPKMGASDAEDRYLKKAFPRESLELRKPTEKEIAIAQVLAEARKKFTHWKSMREALENQLKFHIGAAAGLEGDDFKITWKKSADSDSTNWEMAAREALLTLQMIVSAETAEAKAQGLEVARAACTDLIAKHTRRKLGGRRFLPTGRLFKDQTGEVDG